MRSLTRAAARVLTSAALVGWTTGCVWIVQGVHVAPVAPRTATITTESPVKVHLRDGSTIMYREGVTIAGGTLRGRGVRYDRTLMSWTPAGPVPADSVAAIETFDTYVDGTGTALLSVGTTALLAGVAVALIPHIGVGPGLGSVPLSSRQP